MRKTKSFGRGDAIAYRQLQMDMKAEQAKPGSSIYAERAYQELKMSGLADGLNALMKKAKARNVSHMDEIVSAKLKRKRRR